MLLWVVAAASAATAQEYLDATNPLHARLSEDIAAGRVTRADALMIALRAVFEPDALPVEYAPLAVEPLRCATGILRAADDPDMGLDPARLGELREWRDRSAQRRRVLTHLSANGRFAIDYEVSGVDSVDVTDSDPANGVPDYVERIALELENSWTVEIDSLGFDAPGAGGIPYRVELRSIGSFGYAELDATAPGGTRIVLRNSYEGLPANDDPDGSALGSLRVTAAHEFRHAGQFATSGWSEPGLWIELDAVWVEDQVYDAVNDYVRYLQSASPISDPQLPLDNGGTPSYAESILEFWLAERAGVDAVLDYWERRRTMPGEHPLDSYDAIFTAYYSPLDSAFVDFALYNLQCGSLAVPGIGYAEAALYPDARIAQQLDTIPAAIASTIEHLAAKLYYFTGFSNDYDQDVTVRLRQPDGPALQVAALVFLEDGTRVAESLTMSGIDQTFRLAASAGEIEQLYLVVANGTASGAGKWFFADVAQVPSLAPPPVPALNADHDTLTLAVGQTKDLSIGLDNIGPVASTLQFSARAVDPSFVAPRGIDNSWLTVDRLDYAPGEAIQYSIGVINGGTGLGFISGVSMAVPSGVTLVSGQDIVSESGFRLTFAGLDAQAQRVRWLDFDGGFGAITSGQTGTGKVTFSFALDRTGPALMDWTLDADGYGGGVQQVNGQAVLAGPVDPLVKLICPTPMPPAFVGQTVDVVWLAADPGPVEVELSRDDGQSWETLAASTPNDGYFPWVASAPLTDLARLRVRSAGVESAPSMAFPIMAPLGWATMIPSVGAVPGKDGLGLSLQVNASTLPPGNYPVRVDVRDVNTGASARVDVTVEVVASPVDAPVALRTRVIGVQPNPFNPATEIRFELAAAARVEIEVLDLRGRLVRTLISGTVDAGRHGVAWDGTDADGRQVASGTYLWRLAAGSRTFSGKMSLVR